jgi:hypothetical protein
MFFHPPLTFCSLCPISSSHHHCSNVSNHKETSKCLKNFFYSLCSIFRVQQCPKLKTDFTILDVVHSYIISHHITSRHITSYHIIYIFIHLVVCLTTGPKPLPKRALHIVRSRASSFK